MKKYGVEESTAINQMRISILIARRVVKIEVCNGRQTAIYRSTVKALNQEE